MKLNFLIFFALAFLGSARAQYSEINGGPVNVNPESGVVDGVYISTHIPTKRMIPYEYVREADVIWSKRVWSFIDLREKMNMPLYYPFDYYDLDSNWIKNSTRWSLWTVIKHHVLTGQLEIFEPKNPSDVFGEGPKDGDQFKYPLRPQPGLNYETDPQYKSSVDGYLNFLGKGEYQPVQSKLTPGTDSVSYDPVTGEEVSPPPIFVQEKFPILSQEIVQYRIKEDWFIDKERSVLDVRILGIAPVIYEGGKVGGKYKELFWLYFPQCRFVFNNYFVYNEQNDAQWMSFDDLFWKRRFTSTIYKESNAFDREIESYRLGVDALMESEKIKEEIRIIEHDVWSF